MPSRVHVPARGPRSAARTAIGLAVLATALGACAIPGLSQRTWGLGTTNQAGDSHTITVNDTSGLVAEVTFDPEGADLFGGVTVPAGVPNALDVTWTETACDASTTITIAGRGQGLEIDVSVATGGGGCDAFGTPRAIRLSLVGPIAPAAVSVSQTGQ